jgi:hypothetical protein
MPHSTNPSRSEIWSATLLRRDLSARAHHLARTQNLLHDLHPGSDPIVIFGRNDQGRHGNFHPASDAAICANPAWLRRLTKPHTASRRSRARKDWQWMELDSANSSDALLMNIFCHPGVFSGHTLAPAVANLLNVDPTAQPNFGITPGVPLKTLRKTKGKNAGKNPGAPSPDSGTWVSQPPPKLTTEETLTDRTEIDLQLSNLYLEAKLTESNFQTATPRLLERYRDLEAVFDPTRLPRKILSTPPTHSSAEDDSQLEPEVEDEYNIQLKDPPISTSFRPDPERAQRAEGTVEKPASLPQPTPTLIQGYQLIRNVLAAYANDASFCVLCDARRRDLIEIWYAVLSAVQSPTFATRLKLLTWQELSTTLPQELQQFLAAKYGIFPN